MRIDTRKRSLELLLTAPSLERTTVLSARTASRDLFSLALPTRSKTETDLCYVRTAALSAAERNARPWAVAAMGCQPSAASCPYVRSTARFAHRPTQDILALRVCCRTVYPAPISSPWTLGLEVPTIPCTPRRARQSPFHGQIYAFPSFYA